MFLTDCHAHLADPAFRDDLDQVLVRAEAAGVKTVITVSEDAGDAERNLALAERYPGRVFAAAGLFPARLDLREAERIFGFIRQHRERLVAVGEVGLDRHKVQDPEGIELQRVIFSRFVDLAVELDLPLNVHSRAAGGETITLLLQRGARRVLLHAFDGRAATALPAADAGYLFSIPPSVVRSAQKQKLLRRLPLDSLVLETDSPVLGPYPGIRNEPANLRIALSAIAEIRGLDEEAVAAVMANNVRRLFGELRSTTC